MKWFKHMAVAYKDDKLVSIRARFGMWGVGTYWTLVEFAAEQLKEKSETAEATLIVSDLLGFLGCKRNKLVSFLEHSANVSLIQHSLDGNILKIDIPKLLDIADNYLKYDGYERASLKRVLKESSKHRIDTEEEVEGEEEKSIVSRGKAASGKELLKLDFVLRLHNDEFPMFVAQARTAIAKDNPRFQWGDTTGGFESDLRKLIYTVSDERKKSILTDAYKINNETLNWPAYVLLAIRYTAKSATRTPIHSPYKYAVKMIASPALLAGATFDGKIKLRTT